MMTFLAIVGALALAFIACSLIYLMVVLTSAWGK
jgi:hypothetical protein